MRCKIAADDYGMSIEINTAILELINSNVISKVSVMANDAMEYSIDPDKKIETGLHVNLTLCSDRRGEAISPLNFFYLCFTNEMTTGKIIESIARQYKALQSKKFRISHLDTHHHVHIIPKVLNALIIFAKKNAINSIRCFTMDKKFFFLYLYCLIRFGFIAQVPKMIFLYLVGTIMKSEFDKCKIRYSKNLVIMPLAQKGDYAALLNELLRRFKDIDAEFVTHPGLIHAIREDKYTAGRKIEYDALKSLNKQK